MALLALAGLHGAAHAQAGGPPVDAELSQCAKPVWPVESLRRGQQGTVTMAFKIGADGSVEESKVVTSSGHPMLDEAARFGIAKCQFKPGTAGGKPASPWRQMQYVWTLDHSARDPALQAVFAETRAAAEAGDVEAQLKLGELYQTGGGVQRDAAQARAWLAKAAQYSSGKGVGKDSAQAFAWLQKAADAGVPNAFAGLAWMYRSGQGVERNREESLRLLRRGAELGDPDATHMLGMELYHSHSPRDHAEALPLLAQAAGKNSPQAQAMLGRAYREGRGVPEDAVEAAEWFRKAAAQSFVEAQFALAEMLEQGNGVRKDEAEALRLYELAAGRGWAPALRRMAVVAERGELGRPVDAAAAAQWRARLPAVSAK